MARTWYPVIDYTLCQECGECSGFCRHGVYDSQKAPVPVVTNPEGCIDHCHGCGELCPQGAITYVGDDTGWTPLCGDREEQTACGCGCTSGCDCTSGCCGPAAQLASCDCKSSCCDSNGLGPNPRNKKPVVVEFLYLDLNTCSRCIATDTTVDEAVKELKGVLDSIGFAITVHKVNITTRELAQTYRFESSPTIRVNGMDICTEVKENLCTDCGEICGGDTTCRVFIYEGKEYNQPPKAMVMDGILKALYAPVTKQEEPYTLPDNLKRFFSGLETKCCDSGCCGD